MLERTLRDDKPAEGFLTVIFVETKRAADQLERELWDSGVMCCCIHGDRTQAEREDALAAFKSGETPILVATDVAARGLDISNVGLVVNYDMPKQMDDYVHRIGRTGRAGRKGTAVAFVNERCRYLGELAGLIKQAKQEVPSWLSELARAAGSSWGKGKGKGGGGYSSMAKDIREQAPAKDSTREDWKTKGGDKDKKEEKKKEEPKAAPPPKPRTPSPPRVVPDAWDDSDDDA
jgi:ATP-dependent RNA helicase DDX3X